MADEQVTLTFSSLSPEDQEIARKALAGEIECEAPFENFSLEAATYVLMVRSNTPAWMAAQEVAIEKGLSDGCDVVENLALVR